VSGRNNSHEKAEKKRVELFNKNKNNQNINKK